MIDSEPKDHKFFQYYGKWLLVILFVGTGSGLLSAFFLTSLTWVTNLRILNPWLILFLPLAGALFAYCYQRYGGSSAKGNNLIIETANGGDERIPLRLIPLTLFGTLSAHLFGGSVGREGTAVQMGGSVAAGVSRLFGLAQKEHEILVICGMAGGFSAIFGTPFAGTIFATEVLVLRKIRLEALFPSFLTAIVANLTALSIEITHQHYPMGIVPTFSVLLLVKLVLIGSLFGLTGWLFSRSLVKIKKIYQTVMPNPVIRNSIGGLVVVLLVGVVQTTRYLGLSLDLLADAFQGTNHWFDFIFKLIFTVLTLGAGYQGGEVTPLFEIGATFGSTLGQFFDLPIAFVAALGFIGVFAGATNAPLACFVMGLELFGFSGSGYLIIIVLISYLTSGNQGIYSAQKVNQGKYVRFKRKQT